MPLGLEVDLGPNDIVQIGTQLPPDTERGTCPPLRATYIVAKRSPISATAELFCADASSDWLNVNRCVGVLIVTTILRFLPRDARGAKRGIAIVILSVCL